MSQETPSDPEFVSLLIHHQEVLRSFVHSLVPNHPDLLDFLQEVNVMLWNKRRSFELGTNFGAWIRKVARYMALNERRKLARGNWLTFNEELVENLAEEAPERTSEQFEAKRMALRYCLEKLQSEHRSLLKARYSSEAEFERYAQKEGRSRGSLRVTLHRLRLTLRRCIEQRLAMGKESV